MTPTQLDDLTRQYLATTFNEIEDRLALDWTAGGLEEWGFQLNEQCYELSAALAHGDLSGTIEDARRIAPEADEPSHRKLARRMLEVRLQAGVAELDALSGNPLKRPREIVMRDAEPAKVETKASPLLSQLAIMYAEERIARRAWSPRSTEHNRKIFAVLIDLLGDVPAGTVSKEHIRQLGLDVVALPANLRKVFPGCTPTQALIKAGDAPDVARLAPNSANAYLQLARSLFAWAAENDYIPHNPATILRDVKTGRAADERKPFDDADLKLYFAQLDAKPNTSPFEYWIPRILAYSGCRLGEAAQLQRADVRQERGVWVLDINERHANKRLKTEASNRLVPVHPRLLELGFLEFIAGMPEGFLWPADMRTAPTPERSAIDKLQKLLAKRLRKAGVTDPKKTAAHSFRHTVAARLKAKSVPDYQIAEILGHENDSLSTGRYGSTTDLTKLFEVVSLLALPV